MLSRRMALLALAALPAACASPNPTLYVLAPEPGTTHGKAPRIIELRAISVAHYLERSQIVRSSEGYQMEVLSNEWWGEPLDSMMSRILVQELNQRMPGSTVYGDSGAISTPSDATVEINLQRFDLDREGSVLLAAQIVATAKRTESRGVAITIRPADMTKAIDIHQLTVHIYGNTAIVKGKMDMTSTGAPTKLDVLMVWLKTGQGWQLVARQAVKLP